MSNPNVVSMSSLQSKRRSNRNRKPKYKVSPWLYKDEDDYKKYVAALVRVNVRRQEMLNGSYSPDKDPHISQLTGDDIYKLQLEAILPIQTEKNNNE